MKKAWLIIAFLIHHLNFSVAQQNWSLAKEQNSIKVYLRDHPGRKIKEFKATTIIEDVSLKDIFVLFKDVNNAIKWSYAVDHSSKLASLGISEDIVYYKLDTPWPLKPRDVIQKQSITWTDPNKEFVCSSYSIPNYQPIEKGYVRVLESSVKWTFKKISVNDIAVTYELFTDPKVAIPDNIVQYFIVNGPILVLTKLNDYLKNTSQVTAVNK